jgi:hypothetical protein
MRITNLVTNIKSLGESIDDTRVVKKFLRVVPPRFNQVAVSIEMFCEMKDLTVEDLVGRLRAAEDRLEDKVEHITDKTGRLLLAEEDWLEKHKHHFQSSSNKDSSSSDSCQWKPKAPHRSDGGSSGSFSKQKLTSQGTPWGKGRCRNCGIYGHWAQDCKRPKREKGKEQKQQEANLAVAGGGVDTGALLFAEVQGTVHGAPHFVHLSEEKVIPMICPEGVWVLDTGASNHMTGTKSALSHLDESVSGSARFGDGSTVKICGLGALVVQGKQNQHKVFTSVYYIPQLKSNIISLGQLEEGGCDIRLFNGRLSVLDPENNLLISAPRTGNRLYTLKLDADSLVCFLAKHTDPAWKWHARFGHLNFRSLRELGRLKMVERMPLD